jgi:hypothetical protein
MPYVLVRDVGTTPDLGFAAANGHEGKTEDEIGQGLEERVTDQVDEIERMGRLRRFLPPKSR